MLAKLKRYIRNLLWASPKTLQWQEKRLTRLMEKHKKETDATLRRILEQQQHQQKLLQQMQEENRMLMQTLRNIEFQDEIKKLEADTGITRKPMPLLDTFRQSCPDEDHPLAFLADLYRLHDRLTAANRMEKFRREYVEMATTRCLQALHSQKDAEDEQLIYDALKNEALDALELVGHDQSYYGSKEQYREIKAMIDRPYNYDYFAVLSKPFYEKALEKWYYKNTGHQLNLKHPVTFNDKINWIKLYEKDPRKTEYSDKYAVRDFVAKTIGEQYLVKLLGVWDDPDEIDFDSLPEKFVLKANHGCGWNIIVTDKSKLNIPEAIQKLKKWLGMRQTYVNGLELHYDAIVPRVIAEEYIENADRGIDDYKVLCFHGKAYSIHYMTERREAVKMATYDTQWNKMNFTFFGRPLEREVEKPDNLDELIMLCEKLSAEFNHVRVDFYRLDSGAWKFGEMTFTIGSGRDIWEPPEYDRILGDLLRLPVDGELVE